MTTLYHATALSKLRAILAEGLLPGSYWTSDDDLADYYRSTVEDDGGIPVLLTVELTDLDADALAPDQPSLDEPITTVLGLSEDEVWAQWSRSDQTWQDSLEIVRSLCYERNVSAGNLCVVTADDTESLADYVFLSRL